MLGLLLLIGLAVSLAALETFVRRAAGNHPPYDGRSYESHLAEGSYAGPWAGADGGGIGGGFGGDGGGC